MSDVDVSLGLKAQELLTELQSVTAKIRSFADEAKTHGDRAGVGFTSGLKKALGGIGSFFTNIKNLATSTLGAIGIGIGVGAGIHEIKSVIEYGAHVEDLSRKYGVNAEVLSRLGFAAQKTGTDLDALAKFLGFLEVNHEKAAKGGQKQIDAFKDLGLSAEEAKNRSLGVLDIFQKISQGNLSPDSLKAVGGKAALDVRTLLAGVGAGTVDLDKSLKSDDTAKLKALEESFTNLKQSITVGLAPVIVQVFDYISKGAGTAAGHVEAAVTRIKEAVGLTAQVLRVAGAAALGNPAQIFEELKRLKAETEQAAYNEIQLKPKLLANPDPDQKSVDDAKGAAFHKISSRLTGDEEDKSEGKLDKKQDRNDREARKLALGELAPQERLVELLKEAAKLEKEKDAAKEGEDKIAAEKDYLDVLREVAATKKELERDVAQQEKKEAREAAKDEKEHERDLKEEVRERLGSSGRGRGRGRGGAGGRGVDLDAELDRQQALDDALARDEADRRAHGSYTGPGGRGGLVTGHVQSSGGLTASGIAPLLTDDQFHAQFQRGGGINDRLAKDGLGSLDDFHKQFQQTHGLSRSEQAKKAVEAATGAKKEAVDPLKDSAKLIKESAELLKKAHTNQ